MSLSQRLLDTLCLPPVLSHDSGEEVKIERLKKGKGFVMSNTAK
jgi:hypothetical protein